MSHHRSGPAISDGLCTAARHGIGGDAVDAVDAMSTPEEHHAALAEHGYSIAADVLTAGECDELTATIDAMVGG